MKNKKENIEEVEFYHPTVLVKEVIENFVKKTDGIYVDATCGGGGHSLALLQFYPDIKLIASDWDLDAIKATEKRLKDYLDRVNIIYGSFSGIKEIVKKSGNEKVDGVLVDFGTSRHQIKFGEGFSFQNDTPLDMRMSKGHGRVKAEDIVNFASEKELIHIFLEYGDEYNARKIVKAILEERKINRIKTTMQLANLIEKVVPRKGKIHPSTKVFQALRIAVNKEFEQIKCFLHHVPLILNPGGSLACISFHSKEDLLIKDFYKNNKDVFEQNKLKIIAPEINEVRINSSSRSAKMRVLYKKG